MGDTAVAVLDVEFFDILVAMPVLADLPVLGCVGLLVFVCEAIGLLEAIPLGIKYRFFVELLVCKTLTIICWSQVSIRERETNC